MRRLVVLESPYAGEVEANVAYARACIADCLKRGEAPIASHLLYTQPGVLDDDKPEERMLGIEAGLQWASKGEVSVFYVDRGWSKGMIAGFKRAAKEGRVTEVRELGGEWYAPDLHEADATASWRAFVDQLLSIEKEFASW